MIWLLTLLVSCVTVSSTETCNITVKKGKVLLPKQSWTQGAKFRSHLNALTKEICQQGLHTDNRSLYATFSLLLTLFLNFLELCSKFL